MFQKGTPLFLLLSMNQEYFLDTILVSLSPQPLLPTVVSFVARSHCSFLLTSRPPSDARSPRTNPPHPPCPTPSLSPPYCLIELFIILFPMYLPCQWTSNSCTPCYWPSCSWILYQWPNSSWIPCHWCYSFCTFCQILSSSNKLQDKRHNWKFLLRHFIPVKVTGKQRGIKTYFVLSFRTWKF